MASRYEIHIKQGGSGTPGPPGPPGDDRFAPKYLVGCAPPGGTDTLPAYVSGGFEYFVDPGDGSGIAAALAAAVLVPGDVWIRPGLYNLNLGAVVTPMAVPPGVTVRGSGPTTGIVGRITGNQGVFALAALASLRDMAISVPASDAGSVVSTAVIDCTPAFDSAVVLRDLIITFASAVGGTLREGIRFAGSGGGGIPRQSDVLNVRVTALNSISAVDPSICYRCPPGSFAAARDLSAIGGDIGMRSEGGIFVAHTFLALNWVRYGILTSDGGSTRIHDSGLIVDFALSVGGVCAQLGSGDNVLRAVSCQNNGSAGSHGIWLVDPGSTVNGPELDDLAVFGCEYGIRFGNGIDSSVNAGSVVDAIVNGSNRYGILIENGGGSSSDCHIRGCNVGVFFDGVITPKGIEVNGFRHDVDGNRVNCPASIAVPAKGIEINSPRSTVRGNAIFFTGLYGLHCTAERAVISANEIECGDTPVGGACLRTEGVRTTISGGTNTQGIPYIGPAVQIAASQSATNGIATFVLSAMTPTPGIEVSGDNNTIIGCVCEGSAPDAVLDSGASNEIAHNIGV